MDVGTSVQDLLLLFCGGVEDQFVDSAPASQVLNLCSVGRLTVVFDSAYRNDVICELHYGIDTVKE